jgi:hypothetical protein
MTDSHVSASPEHPAHARHALGLSALWFGILAAPLAWSAEELISYFIASHLCKMKSSTGIVSVALTTSPWFSGLSFVTYVVAFAGLWVAISNWRKTREEHRGSGHHLLELGEGRTRFMAMCGLLASIAAVIGLLFITTQMIVAPLCET